MDNNLPLNQIEDIENSGEIIIQNSEQKSESSQKVKEEIINKPQNQFEDDLEDIKEEEDYYPIMSRIKRNLKEKKMKKKKKGKKDDSKDFEFKKGKEKESSKVPFVKLQKNLLNSNKLNTLLILEPFYTDFINNSEKKGEEILKTISEDYKEEKYGEDNIIYRYGDEADKFFILYEGNVSLFFPFTEIVNMNIDEFFIYILRLRRYNEIEMMNNVLLLNKGIYMVEFDEGFNIDEYILKLYNTSLKLRFDSTFIYKTETKKKIQKIKIKKDKDKPIQNIKKTGINFNKKTSIYKVKINPNYKIADESEFDDNKFKIFNDRETKELVIRIEEEIIETMKWIMPDRLYDIFEKMDGDRKIKKMVQIPEDLIQKYKQNNANIIKDIDYPKRILPPKINNKNLPKNEIIIMKYLYISTLSSGNYFGDFCSDSLTLFCPKYLNLAKNSIIPIKMHEFYLFRNMTVISNTNDTCLLSFNKRIFFTYISKFIENKTYSKKKYLLYNPLFADTNNKNLIRTYSVCFKEKNIKEGEIIVRENEELNESNIYLYFIIKGEFQAYCKKNIFQIDEVIKLLGREDNIIETFPKELKGLIDTKYYNEIANKILNLKLNFLTKNDIIGLSETFLKDKYFNSIICTNPDTKVFCVDMRIVKLLVDSDDIILKNKNVIVYHKYQMLADILLKQRKIYFDSFFNLEKHNIDRNILIHENSNNDIDNEKDNIDNNRNNSKELLGDNFTNSIMNKDNVNFTTLRTIQKLNEFRSSSFDEKMNQLQANSQIIKNMKFAKYKAETISNRKKIFKNLGDLDRMLANLNSNFTLTDKRLERSMEFRKKYFKKMEKLNKEKKMREEARKIRLESQKLLKRSQSSNFNIKTFQKSIYVCRKVFKDLPLLPNKDKFIKSDGQYKLIIPYRVSILKKANSANNINPLAYDDFNRYYNTTQYFQFKKYNNDKERNYFEDKKKKKKKEFLEYNIELKSDIKLKDKKDNKLMRNNLLTKKLRSIYKGKLDKILYKRK